MLATVKVNAAYGDGVGEGGARRQHAGWAWQGTAAAPAPLGQARWWPRRPRAMQRSRVAAPLASAHAAAWPALPAPPRMLWACAVPLAGSALRLSLPHTGAPPNQVLPQPGFRNCSHKERDTFYACPIMLHELGFNRCFLTQKYMLTPK